MTAASQPATELSLQLVPHVCFYGRAEEALAFYADLFDGTYRLMRFSDGPDNCGLPPEQANDVMHAEFSAPGISFLANDGMDRNVEKPGSIQLTLMGPDLERGKRIFAALADGGTVTFPLQPQFWGAQFGLVTDKFGVAWMFSVGTGQA